MIPEKAPLKWILFDLDNTLLDFPKQVRWLFKRLPKIMGYMWMNRIIKATAPSINNFDFHLCIEGYSEVKHKHISLDAKLSCTRRAGLTFFNCKKSKQKCYAS